MVARSTFTFIFHLEPFCISIFYYTESNLIVFLSVYSRRANALKQANGTRYYFFLGVGFDFFLHAIIISCLF